jgi:hypothetical protein
MGEGPNGIETATMGADLPYFKGVYIGDMRSEQEKGRDLK